MTGGGWGLSVKDSTVQSVVERYAEWFGTVIEIFSSGGDGAEGGRGEEGKEEVIGEEGDEENIFQPYVKSSILDSLSFSLSFELMKGSTLQVIEVEKRA